MLVSGSLSAIIRSEIGGSIFVSSLGALGLLVILLESKIKLIDLKKLQIHLREIKETETSVREIASAVLELAESDEDGFKQESWDRERYENAKAQMRKLID